MARHRNIDWSFPENLTTWDEVHCAVLVDIREELRRLNSLLNCPNFVAIPRKLERIARNTTKKRRAKKST